MDDTDIISLEHIDKKARTNSYMWQTLTQSVKYPVVIEYVKSEWFF
jgi:hypothetical protein